MIKIKLKTGDKVKVMKGSYRGSIDYISRLDLKKQLVYLKKISRKKYIRSTTDSKKSELENIMIPVHVSNVAYWLEDRNEVTKISFSKGIDNKKIRQSRKYNIKID
ncbi:hypothetical protein [endosymbiont GvMRE of Glomus versiforme]|uniref:hypothetical protein n=1 Tax=endosymbiont GvMRE of Glomus versiforme TaxID=2039283 RepID=UPI000EF10A58|nr:hypothetical protein [endosymbiont GvMRE of Glomus versiforme]RHZ35401.1 50S ribosomal protein L24 [endosymbiont GvMRE of Glomus versiforme]